MERPMLIDFHIAAENEMSCNRIFKALKVLGGSAKFDQDDETLEWTVTFSKSMVPDYEDLIRLQDELNVLAKPLGGYSDGWGTFGNKK